MNPYARLEKWAVNDVTPIKTILVDFVICRDDDGNRGWQNTPERMADFQAVFDEMNARFSNSPGEVQYPMQCPPANGITFWTDDEGRVDSKVRFKLNHVYFFDSTTFNNACSHVEAWAILDELWATHPEAKGKALVHIFTQPDNTTACAGLDDGLGWGFASTYENDSYVMTRRAMDDDGERDPMKMIHHATHEYGHHLGLAHLYRKGGDINNFMHREFLDDVFGTCSHPAMQDPNSPCFSSCGLPGEACPCLGS